MFVGALDSGPEKESRTILVEVSSQKIFLKVLSSISPTQSTFHLEHIMEKQSGCAPI